MIEGLIIKGIGGFYYIETADSVIECKARGIFRNQNLKLCIGDYVAITIDENGKGVIEEVKKRKSELVRPPIANVTQVIVVFSWNKPNINLKLLNKMLIAAEVEQLKAVICINKKDNCSAKEIEEIQSIFRNTGYPIVFTSIFDEPSIEELKKHLGNNISVLAGPSGVGKSSLIQKIIPERDDVISGDLSKKGGRGKHTTRHVELYKTYGNGYLADTPGFGNLELSGIDENDLSQYFPEFDKLRENCKFKTCVHINEPGCAIKETVGKEISFERYDIYKEIFSESKEARQKGER